MSLRWNLLFVICYLLFFCVHLQNLRAVKNLDTKNKIRFSLIAQINVQLVKNLENSPPFSHLSGKLSGNQEIENTEVNYEQEVS